MHEASFAREILDAVLWRAAEERATRVRLVRGWVAEAEPLSPESLASHFAAHARGTPAEGARLELRFIRVEARCNSCGHRYTPERHPLVCAACGSTDAQLETQAGIGLEALEVE